MNFILISENENLFSSKRLLEEASLQGLPCKHLNPYKSSFTLPLSIKENNPGIVFHRTTGIRFDEFDISQSSVLEASGAKIFNPIKSLIKLRDKELQHIWLAKNSLPIIPTYCFRGEIPKDLPSILEKSFAPHLKDEKFILKTIRGNQGIGVNLIHGYESLLSLLETFYAQGDQKYLLQPFISNTTEFRILISNNKILGVIQKNDQRHFRKNAKRSNDSTFLNSIQTDLHELALSATNRSNLLYAGVDIMEKDGEYFILEINAVPGVEHMEKLSNKNIAKEIILDAIKEVTSAKK